MVRLGHAARLLRDDGWEVARTIGVMAAMRLALWGVPFPIVYGYLQRRKERLAQRRPAGERRSVQQVIRAVRATSHIIPQANCLVQALTAEQLLARAGHLTTLRLGVAPGDAGRLSAHAWVEHEGEVILGGTRAPERFAPLVSQERPTG